MKLSCSKKHFAAAQLFNKISPLAIQFSNRTVLSLQQVPCRSGFDFGLEA